jgi:hypothetical protein
VRSSRLAKVEIASIEVAPIAIPARPSGSDAGVSRGGRTKTTNANVRAASGRFRIAVSRPSMPSARPAKQVASHDSAAPMKDSAAAEKRASSTIAVVAPDGRTQN